MRFQATTRNALNADETALLISMMDGNLMGGIVRKRPDGRFDERAIYAEGSIILALREIPQLKQEDGVVKVIIDNDAHWPEKFPPLEI